MIHARYKGGKLFRTLIFLFVFFSSFYIQAQAVVKISCLMPYELSFSKETLGKVENRVVKYENHDDHTFWYKLTFKEGAKIKYSITSLDNQDNFDVYFYQYDGVNFCRAFIQNSLELISYEKSQEIKAPKGSTYYLGVYPLFPGCGHMIDFSTDKSYTSIEVQNAFKSCESDEVVANPEEFLEDDKVLVEGNVVDAKSRNKINAQITLIDPFTSHEAKVFANDTEGFRIALVEDGEYKVKIQAFGYKDKITAISPYPGDVFSFELESSGEKNFVLDNVYFYPNTYALKDGSEEGLESIFSYLKNHPGTQLEIIGHTNGKKDIKASRLVKEKGPEWNFNGTAKELSLRRAEKIKDFLIDLGADAIHIKTVGKGGDEGIVENPSNMREAMLNIRVEVKVHAQG